MAGKAIENLCDLASSAIGKHHAPGSSREVAQIHSEIMATIRDRVLGKVTEAEAAKRAGTLGRKLSKLRGGEAG